MSRRCPISSALKATLRQRLRAQRQALSVAETARLSALACAQVLALPFLASCRTVALYAATTHEVQTRGLWEALHGRGVACAMPRPLLRPRHLEFALITDYDAMVPGRLGIPEPPGKAIDVECIDLVIVPGLAFDRWGYRLGYGGGFYDRALATYPNRSVGLAFAFQQVPEVPREAHDRAVHGLVTEQGYTCFQAMSGPAAARR